jgi:uridine phosphorylase
MPTKSEQERNTGLQYHIDLRPGDVGEYVLLPGDPARVELFAKLVDKPQKMAYKREFQTYTGYYKGIKVSCTSTGIGSPSTAIAVEELANIGATTFIRIGSCGGLADDVHVRDLIIATGTMRNEGTTPFYAPLALPAVADFYLTQALIQSAEELKVKQDITYHVGISAANDAFYGEKVEFTNKMHDLQLKCVEMESAAIFVITHLRRLRGAAIFTVTATSFTGESLDEMEAGGDSSKWFENMINVALEGIYKFRNQNSLSE